MLFVTPVVLIFKVPFVNSILELSISLDLIYVSTNLSFDIEPLNILFVTPVVLIFKVPFVYSILELSTSLVLIYVSANKEAVILLLVIIFCLVFISELNELNCVCIFVETPLREYNSDDNIIFGRPVNFKSNISIFLQTKSDLL